MEMKVLRMFSSIEKILTSASILKIVDPNEYFVVRINVCK